MKTHILTLEPHDDNTSVRDRMAWGKSARILIVWPEGGGRVLNRRIDLVLMQRRADELGSQLGVVSRDPEVRFYAGELGIPVFHATGQAQTTRWLRRDPDRWPEDLPAPPIRPDLRSRQPSTRSRARPSLWARGIALLAGTLAAVALASVLIPTASIKLQPEVRAQSVRFTAFAAPGITAVNASGAVPLRAVSVVVEGRHTVPTTGRVRVPSDPAAGTAFFTNLTNLALPIPEGAIVLSSGPDSRRYRVTAGGTFEEGPGSTLELPVEAVEPGPDGNLPAGALTAVEGLLGLQVTVTNPLPLQGGTDISLSAASPLDRERAHSDLLEALRLTAGEELEAQLAPRDVVLSSEPALLQTHEEAFLPADESPSDVLEVSLRLEFQLLVIPWSEIDRLGKAVLDAGLAPGFEPVGEALSIEFISSPEANPAGEATWEIQAARSVKAVPATDAVVPELLGRTPAEAGQAIQRAIPLAAPPEIDLFPGWWPRMPLFPVQIRFEGA